MIENIIEGLFNTILDGSKPELYKEMKPCQEDEALDELMNRLELDCKTSNELDSLYSNSALKAEQHGFEQGLRLGLRLAAFAFGDTSCAPRGNNVCVGRDSLLLFQFCLESFRLHFGIVLNINAELCVIYSACLRYGFIDPLTIFKNRLTNSAVRICISHSGRSSGLSIELCVFILQVVLSRPCTAFRPRRTTSTTHYSIPSVSNNSILSGFLANPFTSAKSCHLESSSLNVAPQKNSSGFRITSQISVRRRAMSAACSPPAQFQG